MASRRRRDLTDSGWTFAPESSSKRLPTREPRLEETRVALRAVAAALATNGVAERSG